MKTIKLTSFTLFFLINFFSNAQNFFTVTSHDSAEIYTHTTAIVKVSANGEKNVITNAVQNLASSTDTTRLSSFDNNLILHPNGKLYGLGTSENRKNIFINGATAEAYFYGFFIYEIDTITSDYAIKKTFLYKRTAYPNGQPQDLSGSLFPLNKMFLGSNGLLYLTMYNESTNTIILPKSWTTFHQS